MSWWTSSRRSLARWGDLSWRDRATTASAFAWLLAAEAGLRLLGLPRTRRLMRPRRPSAAPPAPAEIDRLVRLAAGACRVIYRARCLPRSLVLERVLVRHGTPAGLRIGVRVESGQFAAHAWVEVQGRPVAEPEGIDLRFAPLGPGTPGLPDADGSMR
jgi:hypothetical protein